MHFLVSIHHLVESCVFICVALGIPPVVHQIQNFICRP